MPKSRNGNEIGKPCLYMDDDELRDLVQELNHKYSAEIKYTPDRYQLCRQVDAMLNGGAGGRGLSHKKIAEVIYDLSNSLVESYAEGREKGVFHRSTIMALKALGASVRYADPEYVQEVIDRYGELPAELLEDEDEEEIEEEEKRESRKQKRKNKKMRRMLIE